MYDFHSLQSCFSKIWKWRKVLFTVFLNIYKRCLSSLEKGLKKPFEPSEYPQDFDYYDPENRKTLRNFKDVAGGEIITEFVRLKSQMYCYIVDDDHNEKSFKIAKGITNFY